MRTRAGSPSGTLVDRLPRHVLGRLPEIEGPPIRVSFAPTGAKVHAATFIRARRTILDRGLLRHRRELNRILLHELFHYAWVRLGNDARQSFEAVLLAERAARARGELGWSSQIRRDSCSSDYVCEAFCDTAAWLYSGIDMHDEFTLAPRFRNARARWFAAYYRTRPLLV